MRKINKIIIHCSATPNDREVKVDEIRKWHLERGWSDIGYHFIIGRSGVVNSGRPVSRVGAHCRGENKESIGVCLIGNDKFTPEQFNSLRNLYTALKNIYNNIEVFGHNDFTDAKTCPNFEVKQILKEVLC